MKHSIKFRRIFYKRNNTMKRILPVFVLFAVISIRSFSADVNIGVGVGGLSYTPPSVTVNVGDNVIFNGDFSFHPTVQVSQTTWNSNGTAALSGGFSYTSGNTATLIITAAMAGTTLYYVCTNHVFSGMKGVINVNVIASISENRIRSFNFTVFPNPVTSSSQLNISLKKTGKTTITLYDINGRMAAQVFDKVIEAGEITVPFNAASLQRGTYFLLMRTPQGTLKKQIIIQ
jgi:plastocyanin